MPSSLDLPNMTSVLEKKQPDFSQDIKSYACQTLTATNSPLAIAKIEAINKMLLPSSGKEANGLELLQCPATTQLEYWKTWLESNSVTSSGEPPIVVSLSGGRIAYSEGRAVFSGSEELAEPAIKTLALFHLFECELKALEEELTKNLKIAEQDTHLIHKVDTKDLERWTHVCEMSRLAARLRIAYTRVEGEVTRISNSRAQENKALAQFIKIAEYDDRLEHIDDQIEVLEDIYESANDRLSEFSYFWREYKCELWIIVILIGELAFMLAEVYLTLATSN